MKTKQRIINKALELFNQRGIEYVSLHQLAKILDIAPGNISYHFPKKEDLVNALALQFSEKNNLLWQKNIEVDLKDFLKLLKSYFVHQVEYRCLFINFANLQTHHAEIAERNKKEEEVRKKIIYQSIKAMSEKGELKKLSKHEIDFLSRTLLMIMRLWISEATISHPKEKTEKQINYFLKVIGELMMPHRKFIT